MLEDVHGAARPRETPMAGDQKMQPRGIEPADVREHLDTSVRFKVAGMPKVAGINLFFLEHRLEIDHRKVATAGESSVLIEDIGDAARHSGSEIATGFAK